MAILPIVRMGHPVLRQAAQAVAPEAIAELAALIADMDETMRAAPGVGLAAPQVAQALRLLVYRLPADRLSAEEGEEAQPDLTHALINPELEPLDEGVVQGWEGCLSMPGLRGMVPRHHAVRFSGLDALGQPISGIARGFHARVLQHEVDHLDGTLYIDRMTDLSWLSYNEESEHFIGRPLP
jgi:peptide deformylase